METGLDRLICFARKDIKGTNIMVGLADNTALKHFEAAEKASPSEFKRDARGRIVYCTRQLELDPAFAAPSAVLCDLGAARDGRTPQQDPTAQPPAYRAPEVLLGMPWSYGVDIWNVGVMVRGTRSHDRGEV